MKAGQLRTYVISLLMVLALLGSRIAIVSDFSDYHDSRANHIDQANPLDSDMDDSKYKYQTLSSTIVDPYVFPQPEIVSYALAPSPVTLIHPQLYAVQSFPSRASPV
jgi:hypothetical protein